MPSRNPIVSTLSRPWFWLLLIALMFGFPIVRAVTIPAPPALPELSTIPDFTFTDQFGEPFGSADLRGKVWVADFIFTRCPSICPLITEKMRNVQHRARNLGDGFHMVSFTVDPDHDTPAVLAEYARRHKASQTRWTFVTGPFDQLREHVEKGMKIAMGRERPDDPLPSVTHGTHFVLVDQKMRIRGFYDSSDAERMKLLLRDAGLLMNRGY